MEEQQTLEMPAAPQPQQQAHATLVATDGRLIRLHGGMKAGLTITVEGTRTPIVLDAFQTAAAVLAVGELPEG